MGNASSGAPDYLDEFQKGNLEAFEALFRLHQHAVFGWILRIVRNPEAAEDLTVETFWRIYQAHARFEPQRGFEPWARRIATHAAFDYLRTKRPESELPTGLAVETGADPAVSAEIRSKTAMAFGRLPPKLRIAAVLAVVEERPRRRPWHSAGCRPSCASRPFSPWSRNGRTKKW